MSPQSRRNMDAPSDVPTKKQRCGNDGSNALVVTMSSRCPSARDAFKGALQDLLNMHCNLRDIPAQPMKSEGSGNNRCQLGDHNKAAVTTAANKAVHCACARVSHCVECLCVCLLSGKVV